MHWRSSQEERVTDPLIGRISVAQTWCFLSFIWTILGAPIGGSTGSTNVTACNCPKMQPHPLLITPHWANSQPVLVISKLPKFKNWQNTLLLAVEPLLFAKVRDIWPIFEKIQLWPTSAKIERPALSRVELHWQHTTSTIIVNSRLYQPHTLLLGPLPISFLRESIQFCTSSVIEKNQTWPIG